MTFFDDARAIPVPFNLLRLPQLLLYLPCHIFRKAAKFLRGDRKNFARRRFEEHRGRTCLTSTKTLDFLYPLTFSFIFTPINLSVQIDN